MINGLHHPAIVTSDIDRMIGFYTEALGFETIFRSNLDHGTSVDQILGVSASARMAVLTLGNCFLEIYQFLSPRTEESPAGKVYERGYRHLCLDVTDIDAEYHRLRKAGVAFTTAPKTVGSHSKATYGYDPDGNIFELLEHLGEDNFMSLSNAGRFPAPTRPPSPESVAAQRAALHGAVKS
jgi:catechol 2,3-dioxygenase-like lactoylglutathione lyase family enzyme